MKNYGRIDTLDIIKNIAINSFKIPTFIATRPFRNKLTYAESIIALAFSCLFVLLTLGPQSAVFHGIICWALIYFARQTESALVLAYSFMGVIFFCTLFNIFLPVPGMVISIWAMIAAFYMFYYR